MGEDSAKERLEEFRNRKKYASLDEATLKGIEDRHLKQTIIDYLY